MASMREFLTSLATDAAQLGQFIRDPDAAMEAAELPEEDRAVLKSGNAGTIYARLTGQPGAVPTPPTVVLVVDVMPAGERGEQELPVVRSLPLQFPQFPPPPPQIVFPQFPPPPPQIVFPQFPPPPPQIVFPQFPPPPPQIVFPQFR